MSESLWRALKAEVDEPGAVTKSEIRALLKRFPDVEPTPPAPEPNPEPAPPEPTPEPPAPEPAPTPTGFRRTLDDVVYDLWGAPTRTDGKFSGYGKHEAVLGGINPGWDWAHGARPGIAPPYPNGVYNYMNTWGQVVPAAGGMAEIRVRCQVDIPHVWFLVGGKWSLGHSAAAMGGMEGAYWSTASFSPGAKWTSPAQFRSEIGGHSFDLAQTVNTDGSPKTHPVAHWFYKGCWPRIEIPAGAQVAVVTRMRLIPGVDGVDVSKARFVGCFSADAFDTAWTAVGASGNNPALYIPRHKLLTAEWRPFGIVTGTEAQIRAYPPMPFLTESM